MANLNCPFLGLVDDPETCKLFPSEHNCCQRARPVEAVELTHQAAYCLSAQHFRCPVFASQWPITLPAELSASPRRWGNWRWGALSLAAFTLVILLGVFAWQPGLPQYELQQPGRWAAFEQTLTPLATRLPAQPPSSAAAVEVAADATAALQPTPAASAMPGSSPTQPPSFTATSVVCQPPFGWVPYVVRSGDSLYRLGVYYGVSTIELQSANCMGDSTHLMAGRSFYVPNKPSPTPDVEGTPTLSPTDTEQPVSTGTDVPPSDTPTTPASTGTATSAPSSPTATLPASTPRETLPTPTDMRDMPPPNP